MTWWQPSHRFDPRSCVIADRHYNRRKIGSNQFVPPGRCLVLRHDDVGFTKGGLWAFQMKPEDMPPPRLVVDAGQLDFLGVTA